MSENLEYNQDFMSPDVAGAAKLNVVIANLDCSPSTTLDAGDGVSIHNKGKEMLLGLCSRLASGGHADEFAIGIYGFESDVTPIIPIEKAVSPRDIKDFQTTIKGGTNIAKALTYTEAELDKLYKQGGVDFVTVILESDGLSNKVEMVKAANSLKAHPTSPTIAILALGKDADSDALMEIASTATEAQKQSMKFAGVQLENPNKLFLKAHKDDGTIPKELVETARQFLWILSKTV